MSEENNLPKHWQIKTLGEVCDRITKGGTPTTYGFSFVSKGINFIKVENIDGGKVNQLSIRNFISEEAHNYQRKSILEENDLLFSIAGTIGRTCLIEKDYLPANTNQALAILRGYHKHIKPRFLTYQLDSSISQYVKSKARGGAMNNISLEDLKGIELVLPPLSEQQAIVFKIDELLSDLENGKQQLQIVQQQLKIYRQSLLKWAFEGRLSLSWRNANNHIKTGQDILVEIGEKRTSQLKKQIIDGNKESIRILNKIEKHKFNSPIDIEIPKEWCWTSFLQSCYLVVDCHNKTAPYQDQGIYLIRTSNIKSGKLLLSENIKFVSEETYNYWSRRCPPDSGDILFTREAPMGESAIIPKGTKVCMGQRIMLIRTFPELLLPKYLHYAMMESVFQQRMTDNAIGTGVKHLRVGDVEELVFPFCSPEEQQFIVDELESKLTVCDKIEETINQSLLQAESLRQSILKKAFEGKLVKL